MGIDSLNLTFYDIITHLIPGSILVAAVVLLEKIKIPENNQYIWIILAFLGYITGHFLFAIGNILFNSYWHPKKFEDKPILKIIISIIHKLTKFVIRANYKNETITPVKARLGDLVGKRLKTKNVDDLLLFEYCDALVCESNFDERDLLLAKQGFYRSTVALILVLYPYILLKGGFGISAWFWLISFPLLIRLLLGVHQYYGQIRRNQIYILTLKKLEAEK